jgi:SsrA-binding protein
MAQGEKTVATNRKARHEYHISERLEAGMVLHGTEVKSLRAGQANLQEAFCSVDGTDMVLRQCHISPYDHGNLNNHDPVRPRRLLLHKREIAKWSKASRQKGFTIIPLRLYFKDGFAKLEIGLGKGKNLHDKRHDIADRESKVRLDKLNRQRTKE